ncbi:PQQ-binding-like beta-propeller repeat protein [Streptomyces sp. NPDC059631]|uniref:outer membrane protein assembly factor BamB family protein n=1 Tax=unclassified Streptomyces TaxID=2593676 RepID=UPI00368663E6
MTQPPPPPPQQPPHQGGFGPPPGGQPQDQQPEQPGVPPQSPPQSPAQPAPGFGAPQTPPPTAPGFGAPQTPPPTGPPQSPPGYGYPQAPQPPQQPQPPAGYGYPGQPSAPTPAPNTYGAPQPGYGYGRPGQPTQPGYGYPGRPPAVTQPQTAVPGGGAGGGRNKQLLIVVAAVAAIALIVGGGVWYAKSGDGDGKQDTASSGGTTGGGDAGGKSGTGTGGTSAGGKEKAPADTAAKVLYQVPMPVVTDTAATTGSWLTDKVYAKSGFGDITGYDPAKGTKLWSLKLPGPVCQTTRHITADGRTAILYEPAMPTKAKPSHGCSQLAVIDLTAGKKLWTREVKSGDQSVNLSNVTIGGGTVAVGSTNGGAAFTVADGKPLWSPKPDDTCYDAGYGGGDKLVAVRKCGTYGQRQLHIQSIDPASGKVLSDYKLAQGIEYAGIVSTDPLVVAADLGGDHGISDFFALDGATGKLRSHITAPGDQYGGRCDAISRIEYCSGMVVGNDRLYLGTEQHAGSGDHGQTNEIVAFDLATGRQTGQRADAGDGYQIYPLRMDGGALLAYKRPPYDKGGQVVSIDGNSFKETVLLENPADRDVRSAETAMSPDYAEILYGQGRLYMSAVYAHKPRSSAYGKEYLALVFGTSG